MVLAHSRIQQIFSEAYADILVIVSFAVIKHPNQKQLVGERVYFILQLVVHHSEKSKQEPRGRS